MSYNILIVVSVGYSRKEKPNMNYIEVGKQIGKRIQEQRKYIKHVSQERMADDLCMYQADISNLEKGKKGSGIMDLEKLIRLSEYLSVSLEFLIFGMKNNMTQYYKKKSSVEEVEANSNQITLLANLTGRKSTDVKPIAFQSGPFTVCVLKSKVKSAAFPLELFEQRNVTLVDLSVDRYQFFTFYDNDVVSTMTVDKTTLYDNLEPNSVNALHKILYPNFDPTDVLRHLNPFVPLIQFGPKSMQEEYTRKSSIRDSELLCLGDENPILYLESAYVKEEYRKNGIFTLNIDVLKKMFKDAIIWLNMEPLDETESNLSNNAKHFTKDITQITLNNLIAEKLGFTVDPDLWEISVEDDVTHEIRKVKVRKCAYIISELYQKIIANDQNLVEKGRVRQLLKQENQEADKKEDPKLSITYDADVVLDDFNFISEDTKLDFSDMLIEKSEYSFFSEDQTLIFQENPDLPGTEVITELILNDPTNNRKYYFTLVSGNSCHIIFITDKPFKGTYCAILHSENEKLFLEMMEQKSALFDGCSDDNLCETENKGLLPAVKTLVYLNDLTIGEFEKTIKGIRGRKISDFLAKYQLQ